MKPLVFARYRVGFAALMLVLCMAANMFAGSVLDLEPAFEGLTMGQGPDDC